MTTLPLLPNSQVEIDRKIKAGKIAPAWLYILLVSRLVLFIVFQSLIAGIFALFHDPHPWKASTAWWVASATLTNIVSIILLSARAKQEGMHLFDFYRVEKHKVWLELLVGLGFIVISAPLFMLPNLGIGTLLFGNMAIPNAIIAQPLPLGVVLVLLVLFPLTIAFSEIPTYFSFFMKRFSAHTGKGWLAVLLAVLFLSLQHIALPLVFEWRFILWRFLMFLPFAALLGMLLYKRPRFLPYVMGIHALLDLGTVISLLPLAIR